MIGLSNKPTDFLYQSAHRALVPGSGGRAGRVQERRQMQGRAVRDVEVMETDGKGKIRPLFFFYQIVKKVDFKEENVRGKNSSHGSITCLDFQGMVA